MKKSIFFSIFALLLCIGFSSCKPKENQYTLFFKVEKQTPDTEDSLMAVSLSEEYLSVLRTYMEVLDADRGFNFILTATDEEELKTKVSELNQQVVERLNSTELQGFYIVGFFRPQNEKESTELLSTKLGTPLVQGGNSYKIYPLTREESWDEEIPMSSYTDPIYRIELDNWAGLEFQIYNNFVIGADLNDGAGGKSIYIHGGCQNHLYAPITDVIILSANGDRGTGVKGLEDDFTYEYKGRTYHRANPYDGNLNGDLNQGAGGDWLYLMYTTDRYDYDRKLVNMCVYVGNYNFTIPASDMGDGIFAVPMIKEGSNEVIQTQADLTKGTGGSKWIRMLCKYR